MIEGHGDDAGRYNTPIRADFSSNVWYGGLDPGLQTHLQEKIATVTHYPDAGAEGLQQVIADACGLTPDQVLVTNGATEAIYLVAQAFRGRKAIVFTPSFAEYEDACRMHGLDIQRLPWEQLHSSSSSATLASPNIAPSASFPTIAPSVPANAAAPALSSAGLAFICNPNNPTGAALPLAEVRQLLDDHPHCCFVIDESYIEFTRATTSLLPFLSVHPNAIVLRSLTKSCCIPGLRIGYAVAASPLIRAIRQGKMPWSVNRLAIEAGQYIFRHKDRFQLPLTRLLEETAAWQRQLQEATGWQIMPTATHYFIVETKGSIRAADLKADLIAQHGLLIRDAANFPGLTQGHFRVACQHPAHNRLLTDALQQCTHTGRS